MEAAGVPSRRAALRMLDAVLRQGLPLEATIERATRGMAKDADRAFARAIASETLRRLADLDALIDSATRRRLPDDAKARFALRIALVQLLALGTPAHAAISTVLPLVDGGPRRLVHGVFGTLARKAPELPEPPTLQAMAAERWRRAWGDGVVEAASVAIAAPPPIDLSFAAPIVDDPDWVAPGGTSLAPWHRRVPAGSAVEKLPGYRAGGWWVQDLAASIPARLLGAGGGRTVLDLCAAPGGKTMQLASAGWAVTAIDSAPSRINRLRENLARTGLSADVVEADVMTWTPAAPADALLLDAPCSATGIFRRHPDVLHRVHDSVIAHLAALQAAMLGRVADWVTPGGRLVYATCSLEPAEGEDQIAAFLADRADFAIDPVDPAELPDGVAPASDGSIRILPGLLAEVGGIDGFYIARLVRRG